jgi:hypothetical protein
MGERVVPDPSGSNMPLQVVPRLKRILSPGLKVVALTEASVIHGLDSVPVPLLAAEQST